MNLAAFFLTSVTTQTAVIYGAMLYVDNIVLYVDSQKYFADGSNNMTDISY